MASSDMDQSPEDKDVQSQVGSGKGSGRGAKFKTLSRVQPQRMQVKFLWDEARTLPIRFDKCRDRSDIDDAIALCKQALDFHLPSHLKQDTSSEGLTHALYIRFKRYGDPDELRKEIALQRQALELLPSSHHCRSLGNLAQSPATWFGRYDRLDDFDGAVRLHREALKIHPPGHPDRSSSLFKLAYSIQTRFKQLCKLEDLEEATALYREALELRSPGYPNRSVSVFNLAKSVQTRFEQLGKFEVKSLWDKARILPIRFDKCRDSSDIDDAISLYRQALDLDFHPPSNLKRDASPKGLTHALYIRFKRYGDPDELQREVALQRQALERGSSSYHGECLCNLARSLTTRFERYGRLDDLEGAVRLQRETLEIHAPGHPDRSSSLFSLANLVQTRFEQLFKLEDLEEVVRLHREALELHPPGHPNRSSGLFNLAYSVQTRFEQLGKLEDLEEAIALHREALELRTPGHPDRSNSLDNLANSVQTRFEQLGKLKDLEEAIALQRGVLELRPPGHPNRSNSLFNLAYSIQTRFEQVGKLEDLEEAITLHREALELCPLGHPDRSSSLFNLAYSIQTRFEQLGRLEDLEEATALHREALELRPLGHPLRSSSLFNLAYSIQTRFEEIGKLKDLEEATTLHREALELRPPGHPDRSSSLDNLANSVQTRFVQLGELEDLEEATALHREALELCPPGHPSCSTSLFNLANSVQIRFEQLGKLEDLKEATALHRKALELRPPGHPLRSSSLNNLANSIQTRFAQLCKLEDLEEATTLHKEALSLRPPGHPNRSSSLNNLANSIQTRFEQLGKLEDLEEATVLYREALSLRPLGHPGRSTSLNNLANSVQTRFEKLGKLEDLKEATALHVKALELRPPSHSNHSRSLLLLGTMFCVRFRHLGGHDNLDQAMNLYAKATRNTLQPSLLQCFDFAMRWAHQANKHQHSSVIDAYEAALSILPQLLALSLDIKARQAALPPESSGLARAASKCAIQNGKLEKAVEFLETGRGIFWSQILQLRSSQVDRLRGVAPKLAYALSGVSAELDAASHQGFQVENLSNSQKIVIERERSRLRRLNKERSDTLSAIRDLPGFEDFLLPLRLETLQRAANTSPVVFLVANDKGSDCLVMTSTDVQHIQLPNLPTTTLQKSVRLLSRTSTGNRVWRSFTERFDDILDTLPPVFDNLVCNTSTQDSDDGKDGPPQTGAHRGGFGKISSDTAFKEVLEVLWDDIVKPVIEVLHLRKSKDPLPTVYWCPTGPFAFLPIHAAGRYEKNIDYASQYFISSYAPTLDSLLADDPPESADPFSMLAVIQSAGVQQMDHVGLSRPLPPLPSTETELHNIRKHVPPEFLVALGASGAATSVEVIESHMPKSSIVHFACHGIQNQSNPLESGLHIGGRVLTIARVIKQPLPNGSLAFLSACGTAMGVDKLPDEAMSLGACLLYSGFRRVVATMWRIYDEDGPVVADAFYEELFRGADGKPDVRPDITRSALALHLAVDKLRSSGVPFHRWVPFIHMGK